MLYIMSLLKGSTVVKNQDQCVIYRQIHFDSNGQIDWTERVESYLDN